MFLQDWTFLETFDVLEESENGEKVYKLRGEFSRANTVNKNKRIYPLEVLKEAVDSLQDSIDHGGFVGEINHPSTPQVNMDKISHKITQLKLTENGAVIGEIKPAGPRKQDLINLMEDNIRIGVSTRSTGSVKPYNGPLAEGKEGILEVQPGLRLHAIDVVFNPSAGTYPEKIMESEDFSENYLGGNIKFSEVWESVFG